MLLAKGGDAGIGGIGRDMFLELFEDPLGVEFGADTEVHFLRPGGRSSAWFGSYASTRLDSTPLAESRHLTLDTHRVTE